MGFWGWELGLSRLSFYGSDIYICNWVYMGLKGLSGLSMNLFKMVLQNVTRALLGFLREAPYFQRNAETNTVRVYISLFRFGGLR